MNDITPVVIFSVGLLAVALTGLIVVEVIPRLQKLWKPFKDSYPLEAAFLETQAGIAVNGVEQQLGSGEGAAKLDAALAYVEIQAKRYGYVFDPYVVKTMIHAKLRDLKERTAASLAESGK